MIIPSPRPEIANLPPVHHGAFDFAELACHGLRRDDVLDFSVNSNPYGPSPAVRQAIQQVPLDCYPDREAIALRRTLADRLNVRIERLVVGNGTSELLSLVGLAYVRPGDRSLVLAPTYGEYARAVMAMGGFVETVWANETQDFRHSPQEIGAWLQDNSPRLAFVCNPNNPTGTVIPLEVIAAWARENPETLFVVDEAYRKFVPGLESALSLGAPNLLVLASMTKDYAIAGLRLGYAVGQAEVIAALARVRPPWNVNALALAAGQAAVLDDAYLADTLQKLRREREAFFAGLQALGFHLAPSETHYCLVKVGDAAEFRNKLLRHGLQVRDCASFGLPEFVRVATRRSAENERFLSTIKELK